MLLIIINETYFRLLEELLYDGGETGKYILKPPDNLREEFYRMIEWYCT